MTLQGQTWWLIGASEGLGEALARAMAQDGVRVIVSARNAEKLQAIAQTLEGAKSMPVDVTDHTSVAAAAEAVGPVDGVVYLAGAYWPMRAQEWNTQNVEAMLNVNLMGAARVLGHIVPQMVARGTGQIVLTGSLAGYRGLPGAIGYGASKAGLMHLAETLQADLHGTGIVVQQLNPGFIKTRLTDKNDFQMPFIMSPEDAAEKMLALIRTKRRHAAFPWLFGALFRASRFFPDWLFFRIFGARS